MLRKIHTKNRRTMFEWLTAVDYTEQHTQNVRPERIIRQPASIKDTHLELFVRRRQSCTFYANVRCVCRVCVAVQRVLGSSYSFFFFSFHCIHPMCTQTNYHFFFFLFFYSADAESTLSHLISFRNSFIIVLCVR